MSVTGNKYIPVVDRDFFILLHAGLWQRVADELSPSPDWAYIYRLACQQTVQGIVADGISLYQSQHRCNIPQDLEDKFLSAVAQIVRRNYTINQKQQEINKMLSDSRISYFVVKGQMIGKLYPRPMLRCSGDIDYLMPPDDFRTVQDILTPLASGIEPYDQYLQHQGFMLDNIEVEIHGALHPHLGKGIDMVLDNLQEKLFAGTISYDTFSCVYIFLHCLQHFHWSGLGLRQITDWAVLLATSQDIDYHCVMDSITKMGIQQEWNTFYSFCTDWLGLQITRELQHTCSDCTAAASQIWQEAKEGGNMGHNYEQKPKSKNSIIRNTKAWIKIFKLYFKHRSISPNVSKAILRLQFSEYRQRL